MPICLLVCWSALLLPACRPACLTACLLACLLARSLKCLLALACLPACSHPVPHVAAGTECLRLQHKKYAYLSACVVEARCQQVWRDCMQQAELLMDERVLGAGRCRA